MITDNVNRITKSFMNLNKSILPFSELTCDIKVIDKFLKYHPTDEAILYIARDNKIIILLDLKNKKELRWYFGNDDVITSIDVSENGKYLISAAKNNVCKAFEIESGIEIKIFDTEMPTIDMVKFSSDNRFLFVYTHHEDMSHIQIFDFFRENVLKRVVKKNTFDSILFSTSGQHLIILEGGNIFKLGFSKPNSSEFEVVDKNLYSSPGIEKLNEEGNFLFFNEENNSVLGIYSEESMVIVKEFEKENKVYNYTYRLEEDTDYVLENAFYSSSKAKLGALLKSKKSSKEYMYISFDLKIKSESAIPEIRLYEQTSDGVKIFNKKGTKILFMGISLSHGLVNDFYVENLGQTLHTIKTPFLMAVSPIYNRCAITKLKENKEYIEVYDMQNLSLVNIFEINQDSSLIAIFFPFIMDTLVTIDKNGAIEQFNLSKNYKTKLQILNPLDFCVPSLFGNHLIAAENSSEYEEKEACLYILDSSFYYTKNRLNDIFLNKYNEKKGIKNLKMDKMILNMQRGVFSQDGAYFAFDCGKVYSRELCFINCKSLGLIILTLKNESEKVLGERPWSFTSEEKIYFLYVKENAVCKTANFEDFTALEKLELPLSDSNVILKNETFYIYQILFKTEKIIGLEILKGESYNSIYKEIRVYKVGEDDKSDIEWVHSLKLGDIITDCLVVCNKVILKLKSSMIIINLEDLEGNQSCLT